MPEIKLPLDLIIGYSSANDVSPYVLDAEGQPVDITDLNAHIAGLEEKVSDFEATRQTTRKHVNDTIRIHRRLQRKAEARAKQAERERDEAVECLKETDGDLSGLVEWIAFYRLHGAEEVEGGKVVSVDRYAFREHLQRARAVARRVDALLAKLTGGGDA